MRIDVKLAASMPVFFSANRHNNELPANAIIASRVSENVSARGIGELGMVAAEAGGWAGGVCIRQARYRGWPSISNNPRAAARRDAASGISILIFNLSGPSSW